MLTLSWVMMPWDWMGMVTIRSDTRRSTSISGTISRRPGSRTPTTRPRRNNTPRSYCWTIRTDRASPPRISTTSTTTTMVKVDMSTSLPTDRCPPQAAVRSWTAVAEQAQSGEHDGRAFSVGREQLARHLPGVLVQVRQRAKPPHRHTGTAAPPPARWPPPAGGQPAAGPGPNQDQQPDHDRHGGLGPEQLPLADAASDRVVGRRVAPMDDGVDPQRGGGADPQRPGDDRRSGQHPTMHTGTVAALARLAWSRVGISADLAPGRGDQEPGRAEGVQA